MNNRFNLFINQGNDINVDRMAFNNNTRQDKSWKTNPEYKKNYPEYIDETDVNVDRMFFNGTNEKIKYENPYLSSSYVMDRNMSEYVNSNSIKNKHAYHNSGRRIYAANTRNPREELNTEELSFVKRTVDNDAYKPVQNQQQKVNNVAFIDRNSFNMPEIKLNKEKRKTEINNNPIKMNPRTIQHFQPNNQMQQSQQQFNPQQFFPQQQQQQQQQFNPQQYQQFVNNYYNNYPTKPQQ